MLMTLKKRRFDDNFIAGIRSQGSTKSAQFGYSAVPAWLGIGGSDQCGRAISRNFVYLY